MTPLSPTLSKLPLIFCGSPFSSLVTNCSSTVSSIQSLSFTRPPLLSTLVPGDGNSSVDQQPQSQRQRGRQKSCAEKDPRHDTSAVPLQRSEVAPDQQYLDHEHSHYHQQRLHAPPFGSYRIHSTHTPHSLILLNRTGAVRNFREFVLELARIGSDDGPEWKADTG